MQCVYFLIYFLTYCAAQALNPAGGMDWHGSRRRALPNTPSRFKHRWFGLIRRR